MAKCSLIPPGFFAIDSKSGNLLRFFRTFDDPRA
jgi:hypothetical protein